MREPPAPPRRHLLRWVVLSLLVLLVVLALDAAWAGSRAVASLKNARDALKQGGDLLIGGDLSGAREAFDAGQAHAQDASHALDQPGIALLAHAPWLATNIDAARRGSRATADASAGGTAYVGAAQAAGWNGEDIPGFSPGGHIDADAIARAAPGIERAADLLSSAEAELAPVDTSKLVEPLRQPMIDAKDEVDTRAHQAQVAAGLVRLLPALLGVDGEKTYLLVTLSPSDPRAAGGYPGVYGILHADGERVTLSNLAGTSEIPQVRSGVPAPADVLHAYGAYGINKAFWDTTYAPDFPTSAKLMRDIWEAGGGTKVDGVIAGDPSLMAGLLSVVGPVNTAVWPETITSDNVERIVGADVYRTTSDAISDAWELGIGRALWAAVLTRPWPMQPMSAALSSAARDGHLQMWSADPITEEQLQLLGVGGAVSFPTDGSPLVTVNGYTNNRAGYFASTHVSVERGDRLVTATVTIENTAPSQPPSILLGTSPGATAGEALGTFGAEISVYMPPGSRQVKDTIDGKLSYPFEWRLYGRPVITEVPLILPGTTSTIAFTYRLPKA